MTPAKALVNALYERFKGRAPLLVGATCGFGMVYPFVFEDATGRPLGLIGCAWNKGSESDIVQVYHISSFFPKLGAGTKMMQYLCSEADRFQVKLYVNAQPQSTNDEAPLDQDELTHWYSKFGFSGYEEMTRQPKSA